jgi:glycosyltransferase involved in cell wall biosynthesis
LHFGSKILDKTHLTISTLAVRAIILTFNEARHLARCFESRQGIVSDILVADCYSSDDTVRVADAFGARVIQHEWVNYATQFNWALTQLDGDTDWVLRIAADEYLTRELAAEIGEQLPGIRGCLRTNILILLNKKNFDDII